MAIHVNCCNRITENPNSNSNSFIAQRDFFPFLLVFFFSMSSSWCWSCQFEVLAAGRDRLDSSMFSTCILSLSFCFIYPQPTIFQDMEMLGIGNKEAYVCSLGGAGNTQDFSLFVEFLVILVFYLIFSFSE